MAWIQIERRQEFEHTAIERIDGSGSLAEVHDCVAQRRPVVVEGAMEQWWARHEWDFDFFRRRYGQDEVLVRNFSPSAEREFEPCRLADYLDAFAAGDWPDPKRPPYLSDWPCFSFHPELLKHFATPAPFENWLDRLPWALGRALSYKLVLIGPRGAVYAAHVDAAGTHAWIAQFAGRKRFVLFPPQATEALYHGQVDVDDPDLEQHPRFAEAQGRQEAVVEPGQIVFIPSGWWHQVTSLDDSLSIVCNFINRTNIADVLRTGGEVTHYARKALGLRRKSDYYL